jgi:hypothetical protein
MADTQTSARPAAATMAPPQPAPTPQLPQRVKPPLAGGNRILPIIPQDFDQAWRMAQLIAASGTAPKSYRSDSGRGPIQVEMVCVAIMAGLEVGLPPLSAVQGIAVINGIPTIYGDARDGLVAASGLLEDMKEEMTLDDDGLFETATCTIWRAGRKTPISQTITRPQAARAGWLKKAGPWTENPNRMAQQRAKGWASRDAFPDVLKGLTNYDEVMDMLDVTGLGAATTAPAQPRRADFVEPQEQRSDGPPEGEQPQQQQRELDREESAERSKSTEAEGWPLHDATGETVGTYTAVQWADEFEKLTGRLGGADLAAAIDNNREAALKIASECAGEVGQIIADGLTAIFADEPSGERAATTSPSSTTQKALPLDTEDLCPDGATQDETAGKVAALIKSSSTVAKVNQIMKANASRMKGWGQGNRAKVIVAADDRLEDLQMGDAGR